MTPQTSLDATVPLSAVTFAAAPAEVLDVSVERLAAIGGLLAAAESVGAAERLLVVARDYAAERRQFGRTIGSYQALRHLLADMYTRRVSSWSTVLYAAAALDDDLDGALADRVDREGLRRARGARGRARRVPGLRRDRLHRGARRTPLPAPDRRPRAAVRRRRTPRAAARPHAGGVRDGRCGPMTTGFGDSTAQRLERIATGAEPDVVGPLLAEALHDDRWRECDVALISGGKSNLTYRVGSDAGELVLRRPPLGHILPTAHDMAREHRVLSALEGTRGAGPAHVPYRDAGRRARVLRDGARARARLPQRAAGRLRRAAGAAPRGRRGARRRAGRPAHARSGGGRAGRVRAPGRLHGTPAAALVAAVGRDQGRRGPRARPRARASCAARLPSERAGSIVARRLPARQHRPAPDAPRHDRRRPRLGDEHARRSAHRPRGAAGVLERGERRRGAHARRASCPR